MTFLKRIIGMMCKEEDDCDLASFLWCSKATFKRPGVIFVVLRGNIQATWRHFCVAQRQHSSDLASFLWCSEARISKWRIHHDTGPTHQICNGKNAKSVFISKNFPPAAGWFTGPPRDSLPPTFCRPFEHLLPKMALPIDSWVKPLINRNFIRPVILKWDSLREWKITLRTFKENFQPFGQLKTLTCFKPCDVPVTLC